MAPPISALLLAAGSSTRMGQPKALLPLQDKPALLHCLTPLVHGLVWDMIIVLGPDSKAAAAHVENMSVKLMFNTLPGSDMAKSVRLGLAGMNPRSVGALICLVDHPLVQAETIRQIIGAALAAPERIVIPTFEGRRGHPTYFPKGLLTEVYQGFNLRQIIERHPEQATLVPVADEGVVLDMDTPADYRKICQKLEEGQHGK